MSGLFSFALFSQFASSEGPHISLKAEEILKVGEFTYTNSMFYTLFIILFLLFLISYTAKRVKIKPTRGITAIVELLVEYVISMLTTVFGGNRKMAVKFAPVFAVYFMFIMTSNISGLMPWVGLGITSGASPVFRPFTADLNGVIALSLFSIITVQVLSIRESGIKGHLQHYFTDKPQNPINIFVGLLEVLGELTRVISLSLRLFLNTVIGEILVSVFIFISGPATPFSLWIIIMFELLVAYIQAYIFTVLSATYLGMAIHHDHDEHEAKPTNSSAHQPLDLESSGAK